MENLPVNNRHMLMQVDSSQVSTRQVAEVQAQLFSAKQFPRDEQKCHEMMLRNCDRLNFADKAIFSYRRGGQPIEGLTIRAAEMMARCWQNIQHGTVEVSKDTDSTKFKSFAWDVQNNVRIEKEFSVKHERHTKKGRQKLTDPRDEYEHIANYAARTRRGCILELLPTDFVEDVFIACKDRVTKRDKATREEYLKIIPRSFKSFGVSIEMIEKKFNAKLKNLSDDQIQELREIRSALSDGAKREEFFIAEELVKVDLFKKDSNHNTYQKLINAVLTSKTKLELGQVEHNFQEKNINLSLTDEQKKSFLDTVKFKLNELSK